MLNTQFTMEEPAASSAGILQLTGSATMEFCTELRMALLDALNKVESLVVDVSRTSELDVPALQLFCAARRSAIKRQKNMVLAGKLSDAFSTAVLEAGFTRTHTSSCWLTAGQTCLWDCCKPAVMEVEP